MTAKSQPHPVKDLGEVVVAAIEHVKPCPTNPRKISDKAVQIVALSLQRFGWQQPLVTDESGVIIAGHTRLLAAQQLKLTKVPVVIARGLTPAEIEAYRITDNRTHDFTTWDYPELSAQLDALAGEFSDVLALADWGGLMDQLPGGQTFDPALGNGEGGDPLVDSLVDMGADQVAHTGIGGFYVTLVFDDEESAKRVERTLIEIEGVRDVRYVRQP